MTFIFGGIKSGKSSHASHLAQNRKKDGTIMYLATALANDLEMTERIRRHQADRPIDWITCEEPLDPASVFQREKTAKSIILDCITNWLTNLIEALGESPDRQKVFDMGHAEVKRLIESIDLWEKQGGECFVVSNQVENGLISTWSLGRVFQDLSGMTHQKLAKTATNVYLMNAGIALKIK